MTANKVSSFTKYTSWIYDIPSDYYVVALLTIVVYFISYLGFPSTPGNQEAYFMGWFGWCDQGWYLKSAKAIAHWKLSSETYVYPLGYPLLGVPFLKLLPRHPFLIPNLFFSVGIVLSFYGSCRKFITRMESAFLTIFLIILSAFTRTKAIVGGLLWFNSLIVPWNLIPVFFASYLATWLLVFNKANFHKLWIVSFFIALAFFSRPPDVLFLGIIYLAGLIDLKSSKEKIQGLMILIFPCLLVLAVILISKWAVFHSLLGSYEIAMLNQGFNLYDFPFKFYLIFFDGSPICGFKECMLLPQMPWLLLCVPGIMLLAKYTKAKSWFLMLSIALCLIIYIAFNAQVPSNFLVYFGYRYFIWVFPWLGLCAYFTLTRAYWELGKKITIFGVLSLVLFSAIIGWKETKVFTISPADKQNIEKIVQSYDPKARLYSCEINLPKPIAAGGIKIAFIKLPSYNLQVAGDWDKFSLSLDGRDQLLIRDYNLYQSGKDVYVSFRNKVNQAGFLKKFSFKYADTDKPELKRISVLKKEFELFGFMKSMFNRLGIVHDPVRVSDDQGYTLGSSIMMGAGGNSDSYKISGWSGEEQEWTWSEGHRALLGFKILAVKTDLTMSIEASGLSSPIPQTVVIGVNGRALKKVILSSKRQIYDITIPLEYIRPDGALLIQFDFPNAKRPIELGINHDRRVLSMAVYGIKLIPCKFINK